MSYVDENLLPGEHVTFRTHLHSSTFFWPVFLTLFAALLLKGPVAVRILVLLVMLLLDGAIILQFASSEIAVTNKRVIIKAGILHRRTLELRLRKIAAIAVDQGIGGRIFGYGTITVSGIGGIKEPFKRIADPLRFRQAVHALRRFRPRPSNRGRTGHEGAQWAAPSPAVW